MLCFRLQNYNFFMKPAHHKQIFIDFSINLASFSDGYISYMEGSCGIKHKKNTILVAAIGELRNN